MVRARFSYLHAVALRLVVRSALLPLRTIAADPSNLKGTWRIASQSSFKPEGGAIPFTAEGRKRYQENKRDQVKGDIDQFDYDTARCASPVCRAMAADPLKIPGYGGTGRARVPCPRASVRSSDVAVPYDHRLV